MPLSQARPQHFTWEPALGNRLLQHTRAAPGPAGQLAGTAHRGTNSRTGAEFRAGPRGGSSQGCLPPAPATRGIPAGHFPQSPPHPTAPGTPSVEVNEDGRQRCPPGPLPRPQLAAQAEPAPVNWIKGRPAGAGRREPHRGCPAAAIGAARARPAPRELLEAGWDPRVPRLK